EHDRHPPDVGDHLLDDVQPFADYGKVDIRDAGDVPAWTSKARDEALSGRIVDSREDDRDGARGLFQRRNDRRGAGGDDVWWRVHQFKDVCLYAGNVAAGKSVLDLNVPVLRPSERLKSLSKRRYASFYLGIDFGEPMQERDAPHPLRLLRARRERPHGRRAAEKRNKLASPDCGHGHPPPNMTTMNSHTTRCRSATAKSLDRT